MKNQINKGLFLFFITLAVLLFVTVSAAAQSGHGGSTHVIARIEPPSSVASEETQSTDSSSDISQESSSCESESSPASTGDSDPTWLWAVLASGSVLTAAFAAQKHRNHG